MFYFRTTGNVQNYSSNSSIDTSIVVDESFEEERSSQREDTTGQKQNAMQEGR